MSKYLDSAGVEALWTNAKATFTKIDTGSYEGTGEYKAESPNTLTFPFTPKVVLISDGGSGGYGVAPYVWGAEKMIVVKGNAANAKLAVTINGNTMSWYDSSVQGQLNQDGYTYRYVALG